MLAVLNRYRLFLVILLLIIIAALIWAYITVQGGNKTPSRGVFVMEHIGYEYFLKGGWFFCSR